MPHYDYDKDYPFAAFITNLGKYNEGALVGEWVKFPTTAEELKNPESLISQTFKVFLSIRGCQFCPLTGYFTLPRYNLCHKAISFILFRGKVFILFTFG